MIELIILTGAIVAGGLGIVTWLNITAEWAERDQLRKFQEAMRAGGRGTPLPTRDED